LTPQPGNGIGVEDAQKLLGRESFGDARHQHARVVHEKVNATIPC